MHKPAKRRLRRLLPALFGAVLGAVGGVASAADGGSSVLFEGLTLRGFGTLGMARTTDDQVEFVRDLSQPGGVGTRWSPKIDSVVGLQANFALRDGLEAVAQVVSRYRPDGSYRPELTWAFLHFDPNPNLSLRAGRLGTEFYMLADSRLVGYSYLTVRPPVDYFGGLTFSYIDGADVSATLPLGPGLLRGKLYSGVSREEVRIVSDRLDLDGSRLTGGHLDYLQGSWLWRLGYVQVRFRNELPSPVSDLRQLIAPLGGAAIADDLSLAGKLARFYSAGVSYDSGPLQAQLMLSRTRHESAAYQDSRAGYVVAGYRLGEFTPYLGRSWVHSSENTFSSATLPGPLLDQVNNLVLGTVSNQYTNFLGVRWDFRSNMALKAQLDSIHGTPSSTYPFRQEKGAYDGRMTVFSVALDFIF